MIRPQACRLVDSLEIAADTATSSLLDYWTRFTSRTPPFVHPDDAGSEHLSQFELSLLPIPYVGNLREAECVILMLNPGLDAEDLAWEQQPRFRAAVERNLRQSFPAGSLPHFYLDPEFERHPGAGYWSRSRGIAGKRDPQKLRSVIQALARRDGVSESAARAHVARKVATVQLAPYHSARLERRGALQKLPSAQRSREFVHALIRDESKLVIAARSVREWGLAGARSTRRLVVYEHRLGASASLSDASEGGRALIEQLSRVEE